MVFKVERSIDCKNRNYYYFNYFFAKILFRQKKGKVFCLNFYFFEFWGLGLLATSGLGF
jgi:hypothetical protein